ncbi:MAG TPA: hypothetical protein VGN36_07665 [Sphingorhabdus sp.]|jgi:hypothetical protein|nr:hypothetical protein [Sphingorhabdus sp.]
MVTDARAAIDPGFRPDCGDIVCAGADGCGLGAGAEMEAAMTIASWVRTSDDQKLIVQASMSINMPALGAVRQFVTVAAGFSLIEAFETPELRQKSPRQM